MRRPDAPDDSHNLWEKPEVVPVIRANLKGVDACFEQAMQRERHLGGRVLSAFAIGEDGSVANVHFCDTSTLKQDAFLFCLRNEIRGWKFPVPRGNGTVHVTYPFVFRRR